MSKEKNPMPVADPLTTIGWEVFEALDLIGKAGYLQAPDGRENHVLIAQQFGRARLDRQQNIHRRPLRQLHLPPLRP